MKKLIAILILSAVLAGCAHTVGKYGEMCWRYGVEEEFNTGRMTRTPVDEIPIKRLNYTDLLDACGLEREEWTWANKDQLQIRACFDPVTDTIYEYRLNRLSNYFVQHEKCHALLGREHNSCWGKGYAQFGKTKQSACDWNEDTL